MSKPVSLAAAEQTEPAMTAVQTFAVRRADEDLDSFVDTLVALLDDDRALVDLSHHDRHATTIELRIADREGRRPQ
jgi:hypothetical protein